MVTTGSKCTVIRQVIIDDQVAFEAGEGVTVENVQPDPQRPDNKYVVYSQGLQKRYLLSDADIRESQPVPVAPPATVPPPGVSPTRTKRTISDRWRGLSPRGKAVVAGIVVVILIIGIVAAVSGSGKKETEKTRTTTEAPATPADTTPADTQPSAPPATPPAAPAQPEVRTLQGSGNQATQAFNLRGGLAIFHMQGTSSGNFAVELMSQATGQLDALLANVIGNYSGSQAIGVSPGTYVFNITSEGPWTIGIEEPRPTTAASTPQTFSGSTPMASGFFTASNGLATFTMNHQGDGNFSVQVFDTEGNMVDLPANEIGPYQGSQAVSLGAGDIYILNVEANGPWSVQVQ